MSGIVTAVDSGQYKNFYIEERPGGKWRGIFLYDNTIQPQRRDSITVTAEVYEHYVMNKLMNVSDYIVHSYDNSLPSPFGSYFKIRLKKYCCIYKTFFHFILFLFQ